MDFPKLLLILSIYAFIFCLNTNSSTAKLDETAEEENSEAEYDTIEHEKDTTLRPPKPSSPSAPSFRKKDDLHPTVAKPAGNSVELKCQATGNPTPNITWIKDGFPATRTLGTIKPRGKWSIIMEDSRIGDEGNYTCVVCNMYGCINHTFKVKIVERPRAKPQIKDGFPKNLTVLVNTNATFECPSHASNAWYVEWIRPFSNQSLNATFPPEGYHIKENEAILELPNLTHDDAGWYTCVVANNLGASYANAYLKVVDELEDPLKMTTMPSPYNSTTLKKEQPNNQSTNWLTENIHLIIILIVAVTFTVVAVFVVYRKYAVRSRNMQQQINKMGMEMAAES